MLINLRVDNPILKDNRLFFDLPPTTFHRGQMIGVAGIHIKWSQQVRYATAILTSTLIEKSSCNPTQQLLLAYENGNSHFLHYTPTQIQYYKIQCMELQSSEFYLFDYNRNKIKNIESIFLQLEIIDERIQSVAQKTK